MKKVSKGYPDAYHVPVLYKEVVESLMINPNGIYYDGTLGGGGHAELFLHKLSNNAVYIGIDRDAEAIEFAKKRLANYNNLIVYNGTFNMFESAMKYAGVEKLDGILLDLGVSTHQIDEDIRGFTFRPGVPLDMRMNNSDSLMAADVLNTYDEDRLIKIFKEYGEERFSKNIARRIVKRREDKTITTSDQLLDIINHSVPGKFLVKSYARIFQALRIEVNNELDILRDALEQSLIYLEKGGRLGVIAYHSGEDRIVKEFIQRQENPCECSKDLPYCVCGKKPQMRRIKPYPITPAAEEIAENPRARSAKFRVGERI
ncbi:MAG TPA: 16S rRNA (cytosine(1402)-N(4))-methyltransferase RsmH [Caldithrix sp.]|nr:16S rRNA (cytosine(1402)-N(4))-methyltransferase RsmH [Calditrichaceae bacterium]HEM48633.1 16S rRNA (cytosine(1402)-N(4))-methyltransferase RsmH [Caldithrix sp.]